MISLQEYIARRQKLLQQLPPDSIALIPSAQETIRNGDAHYRFRQNSDFYYLTGFNEPNALLLISHDGVVLFNQPRDAQKEHWSGARMGQDQACTLLGVDSALSIDTLEQQLPNLLSGKQAIYYPFGCPKYWETQFQNAWQLLRNTHRRGDKSAHAWCDLSSILAEMRVIKSDAEISLMREAARISVIGHQRVMSMTYQANYEYQLEAEFAYELTRQGCRNLAYDSIVAGGSNACVLHYVDNNKPLNPQELLLIDAGGEYQNYAADITRTYPIRGRFSHEQRLIYELVLDAQRQGIAAIRPGCAWGAIQQVIVKVLTQGLIDLNLLKGSLDDLIAQGAYQLFYKHQSGHWLGLDVHDCGAYSVQGQSRLLEPNMVLTVEPGLYISEMLVGRDNPFAGIGVRIEDDIRVSSDGFENLTAELAVDADELELLIRG